MLYFQVSSPKKQAPIEQKNKQGVKINMKKSKPLNANLHNPGEVCVQGLPSLFSKTILSFAAALLITLFMAFQAKGQSITLLSPNGGEVWMTATSQTILWEWEDTSTEVDVYYSQDEGETWNFMGNSDGGAESLDITAYLIPSEFCKFRVTSAEDQFITDDSDDYFTVIANPVYFNTPQAGDEFYPEQTASLQWDSFMFLTCDLHYSTDGGQTWMLVESNMILNFYDWTVPDVISDQCMLKVSDANDPTVYGLSAIFSIVAQATAVFTSPVGGDIWTFGEEVTMSWTGENLPLSVYFDYSLDGGQSWNYLGNAISEPADGSVELSIPKVASTNVKIRMMNADYTFMFGITEDPFTFYVPPVFVFYPDDGQKVYLNGSIQIIWLVYEVELVNLELSIDGGENWEIIESNLDGDQYTFNWTVTGSPSDDCYFKIVDVSDPTKFDISGRVEILETPVITLTNPIGNELWRTDETYTISWSYDNPEVFYVIAEYSIDSGANWSYIAFGLPAEGSIDWETPALESEQCLIRVFDSGLPFVADTSELFAIRDFPYSPICIVSVDSTSNQNVIIWEKPATDQIRDYIVYKETNQMDIFEPIGTVAYDSLPFFVDVNSNPTVKSYRYKLGYDDSEGYVYPMGDMHQTIHLTMSMGIGDSWNLNWSSYIGFDFASYNIYRSSNGTAYELIETISSSFFSFTDIEAPAGQVFYYIEVEKENGCNLSTREYQVSSAFSNIVTNNVLSVDNPENRLINNVYPNPSNQWLNIVTGVESGILEIALHDIAGRTIMKEKYGKVSKNYQATLNVSSVEDGIYFLKVISGKSFQSQKVVVRH